jgi:transcriptional regulator with XRE-family HTH domain
MAVSLKALKDASLCAQVLNRYRSLEESMEQIGEALGLTHHTISAILKANMTPDEFKRAKAANYSRSKAGKLNPQFGARYAAERIMRNGRHAKWNGDGYTAEHRTIAAKMLGLKELPSTVEVHHIDRDKTNNNPDNLAIVTKAGHQRLHRQFAGRLYVWEKEKFGTSLLKEMQATLLKD